MNWRNVNLIFLREVRDQLRDRRTLFMVAVLPLILYPVMGIGSMYMSTMFSDEMRTVVIVNADDLPGPPLVENGKFLERYFSVPTDAEKLKVLADNQTEGLSDDQRRFLTELKDRLPDLDAIGQTAADLRKAEDERRGPDVAALSQKLDELRSKVSSWFERAPVQVLIVVPKGLKQQVETLNQSLVDHTSADVAAMPALHPFVLENSADERSSIAFGRVREALASWERAVLDARLHRASLPSTLTKPVNPVTVDLARQEKVSASKWGRICPALLVILAVTGAFYPANDLSAGEKERGTMETLLISPATRQEIVTGKFLTVMLFSVSTALLNLASIGFTIRHMAAVRGGTAMSEDMSMPAIAIVWIVLLAMPLSALFSALSLAFAMFARSTKEGQYYLTPLLMVTMGLMMFSMYPDVELTPFYSVMPVVGPALLLKALLLGSATVGSLPFFAVAVVVSSVCYSLLALWWAIEQFLREDVLFREAERFDLGLWLRHLLREKESIPSFSEAAFCFVLILLLQFASFNEMRKQFEAAPGEGRVLQLQMIYLLATVATPALLMAVLLTRDPRRTLKLRLCSPKWLAAAVVLPFVLYPLSVELLSRLAWFFPELPAGIERTLSAMSSRNLPLWFPLLAFADMPALCEELAFRGFILSGLQRSQRYRLAAVMSSVAFGIVHMIPQQVFNATLLGLVLAALALRSGSLFPCIVFHFLFNGMQVVLSRVEPALVQQWGLDSIARFEAGQWRFSWPVLGVCAAIAAPLLYWLVRGPVAKGWRDVEAERTPETVVSGPAVKGLV